MKTLMTIRSWHYFVYTITSIAFVAVCAAEEYEWVHVPPPTTPLSLIPYVAIVLTGLITLLGWGLAFDSIGKSDALPRIKALWVVLICLLLPIAVPLAWSKFGISASHKV